MVLLEAGTRRSSRPTEPLLHWLGPGGVLSDVFSRVGAFAFAADAAARRPWHEDCVATRADVHVRVDGQGVILDNTWFWHADHDNCEGFSGVRQSDARRVAWRSDASLSRHGIVVNGDDVIVYGLKVEHTQGHLVQWNGERGQVYGYQSELPYHDATFSMEGHAGYFVNYHVRRHMAVGIAVYIVFGGLEGVTAIRAPPTASFRNAVIWSILGSVDQFDHLICTSPGFDQCFWGTHCSGNVCYLPSLRDNELLYF